jgi:hypothetical protein
MAKNWNCDNDKCVDAHGEVRVYPLGGGGNLILCQVCWAHENHYRIDRGIETRQPENWPPQNWYSAEIYRPGG